MLPKVKANRVARILAMGLQDSEKEFFEDLYSDGSHEIIFSNNDMDMWDHAGHEKYDLCAVGQTEENQDLNFVTWLLKGILKPSQVVVIMDDYSRAEWKYLRKHKIRFILNRPLDPNLLSETIEKALRYNKPWYIRLLLLLR